VDNNISLNRKSRISHKVTEKIQESLNVNNVTSIEKSYRSLGKKYNLRGHTIKRVLIVSGLKRKNRKKCPKSDEKQKYETKEMLKQIGKKLSLTFK
jgi:hypothetical protein